MQKQYVQMRETAFDLYTERDALPWYYRACALTSSCSCLAGYIIFALVFTSDESNVKVSRTALIVLASIFLIAGYASASAIAFFGRSLLFFYDGVLIPILTSSFMGIVVTVLNHALHKDFPIPNHAYIYIPLVTACTTTVASAALTFVIYKRLAKMKRLDNHRRQRIRKFDRHSSMSYGDAASTTELLPIDPSIPEDEAQRRQLLRLLLNREAAEQSSPSPGMPSSESTYKIFLPGDEGFGGTQVVPASARPRSGSLPNSSTSAKWNLLAKITGDHSPPVESSFKDHRQRRREEIERSSILMPAGTDSPWLQPFSAASPSPSHSLSWSRSARYA
ncbi:hypothetical protein PV08_03108 [Exophiala spinifera]|uniref:Uncharacterized protein n=1 Tax=Exophiala spinifera TaxID=91928 RepID=A0A0D2C5F1_9EURO|nr:uncharacterized protein PV08_03108 [Exophiala spinifera]KIW18819.1 hypothetical protein PV08_03108 [Exophiala spinifera]